MLDKEELNVIRGALKRTTKEVEQIYSRLHQAIDMTNKLDYGNIDDIKTIVNYLNTKLGIDLKPNQANIFGIKKIIAELEKQLSRLSTHIKARKHITSSLSKNGINRTTYSFPIFYTMINSPSLAFQYLIISGIKYNGEHKKNDSSFMNTQELKLHEYEQEMAKLINEDFSIDTKNIPHFIKLFISYTTNYLSSMEEIISIDNTALEVIKENMENYLLKSKNFIETRKAELAKEKIDRSRLSKTKQINTDEDEIELLNPKQLLLQTIVSQELYELYNKAKATNSIRAINLLKDIDASLELLLELGTQNNQDLIEECITNLAKLNDTIAPRITYYKTSKDGETYPLVLESISNIQSNDYKAIGTVITEISLGNISSGRKLQGDLPIEVYAIKANDTRIFYTLINDIAMIIDIADKNTSDNTVKNLVSQEQFLTQYQETKKLLASGEIQNEQGCTTAILDELSKANNHTQKRLLTKQK